MKKRFSALAALCLALLAIATVLSSVFFSQPNKKNSASNEASVSTTSNSSSATTTSFTSSKLASNQTSLRSDQPEEFRPLAHPKEPTWKLLDWSVKPFPGKPGIELRASSWAAPGKHSFVRLEEEVRRESPVGLVVLHRREMVGDHIIVKLPENSTQKKAQEMASKIGARASAQPFAPNTWLFQLDRKLEAVPKGMEGLQSSGAKIEYTEPDLIVRPARLPNDPKVTDFTSWHLYNNTQIDQDIKAAKAWDRRTSATYGSTSKVIVAVIDSGVCYTHEDLAANMWRNPGETAGDGIDNDGNGWVDDIYGIDAYGTEDWNDRDDDAKKDTNLFESGFTDANGNLRWDTDTNPMDEDGHGTQCAGLIGAVGNNGVGIAGVAWAGIEMMALRFIGNDIGSVSDEVLCMDYARLHGAKIINASFGQNGGSSSTEIDAITRLNSSGVILVAAAGNGGDDQVGDNNNGANPWYPASYTNANIITVGATDRNDRKLNFSNYGATAVDLFAPGASIYSTFATSDTSYVTDSGTSFAAPLVVGALALLVAEYPNDTVSQRVARVVNTNAVDVVPALSGLCVTGGRLNLAKLLPAADVSTLPSALAWHRPNYHEPLISSSMRTPTPVLLSNDVTIFSGLKKFNNTDGLNTYGLANQTGGWLFYRTSGVVAWSSNALSFHANSGDYQFWKATIPGVSARTYEYYLQLDFDSGARTTFSHYANNIQGFTAATNQTSAAASPYTFSVPKATPSISTPPSASPIRFGQSLADSSLNGGVGSVPGNFSFTQPTLVPALGTSSNSVTFIPTDPSNYETAFTSASVTVGGILNPSQDSDGDGIPNLLEHALAGFSTPPSTSSPLGQITTQSLVGTQGPETILSVDVTVRTDDPALTIQPEASLDLASETNWMTNGFTIHIPDQTDVPPGFELRQYRFHAGTNSRAFLRLNVQQQ